MADRDFTDPFDFGLPGFPLTLPPRPSLRLPAPEPLPMVSIFEACNQVFESAFEFVQDADGMWRPLRRDAERAVAELDAALARLEAWPTGGHEP